MINMYSLIDCIMWVIVGYFFGLASGGLLYLFLSREEHEDE